MSAALKLMGACMLVLAGYAAGRQQAEKKRRKVQALEQLGRLMAYIQDEITYRAAPLADILAALPQNGGWQALRLEDCANLRELACPPYLEQAQWAVLGRFFRQLGQTTGQESARQYAYYQKKCAGFLGEAQQEYRQAKQLYTKMGLCCGSLLALLLL